MVLIYYLKWKCKTKKQFFQSFSYNLWVSVRKNLMWKLIKLSLKSGCTILYSNTLMVSSPNNCRYFLLLCESLLAWKC